MIIDVLQHVSFEDPAAIADWGKENGHTFRIHKLYENAPVPDCKQIDFLIVLGGPMSVNDLEYTWVEEERKLIKEMISKNKPMLGICLGAQQIAKSLGSTIFEGEFKEVGWFTVNSDSKQFDFIPETMTVFHWHGEQFKLPEGSQRLFSNDVCENQGFIYQDRVIGLQFHFESTKASIDSLLENERAYLDNSAYVQTEETIRNWKIPENNITVLYKLLNHLIKETN